MDRHEFWKTQPVPKIGTKVEKPGTIYAQLPRAFDNPIILPDECEWKTLDIEDESDLDSLHSFLSEHYVQDTDDRFRLRYSKEFITLLLTQNDTRSVAAITLRETGQIIGCISYVMTTNVVHGESFQMAEVNFLCIDETFRNKRMAPVLISEITRRVTRHGIDKAMYTVGNKIPTPFSVTRYYHRPLNVRFLIDIGFMDCGDQTMESVEKIYQLPSKMSRNFVRLDESNLEGAYSCFISYVDNGYDCYPDFSLEEFRHMFLHNDVVRTYVVTDTENSNEVLDFCSYYNLDSTVVSDGSIMRAANLFYYSCNNTDLRMICLNLMIEAKNRGIDVFNATDMGENLKILSDLRFISGTGVSYYYMYNYRVPPIVPTKIFKIIP